MKAHISIEYILTNAIGHNNLQFIKSFSQHNFKKRYAVAYFGYILEIDIFAH